VNRSKQRQLRIDFLCSLCFLLLRNIGQPLITAGKKMSGILLALTMGLSVSPGFVGEDEAKKHGWYTDYNQALSEARKSGRLLFVVFR
jgi:hypothetical protein